GGGRWALVAAVSCQRVHAEVGGEYPDGALRRGAMGGYDRDQQSRFQAPQFLDEPFGAWFILRNQQLRRSNRRGVVHQRRGRRIEVRGGKLAGREVGVGQSH